MDIFSDLVIMRKERILPLIVFERSGGLIFIHMNSLLRSWMEWKYENCEDKKFLSWKEIRAYFRSCPGFIKLTLPKRIEGKTYRVMVFTSGKAPDSLKELIKI